MAHESFENAAIAHKLNRDFVPVKVDREERPDVDRVYMTYVQAATGQGGWPMSVWLTPDLKPFYGGTYFPPEDRWGRPGLASILDALTRAWADEREKLVAEGERVTEALPQPAGGPNPKLQTQSSEPDDAALVAAGGAFERCFQQLAETFDPTHGGFGGAPKFPRAAVFTFLFRVATTQGIAAETGAGAARMAALTLRRMAEGGLHDHVGGGFHRYSVDEEWFVPHFEKMLYDQAQLAVCYLEARQATGDERYAWVAREIFDYVLRDLASPAGGFYSAEDADSPLPAENQGEGRAANVEGPQAEGAFYVWTKAEIAEALGPGAAAPSPPADATSLLRQGGEAHGASHSQDDIDLFCAHFDVHDGGNVPAARDPHGEFRGKNILRQRQPLAETARQSGLDPLTAGDRLQGCLRRLQAVRARRPRPPLDDKIITAWNGLMISALAKGHQVLGGGSLRAGDDVCSGAASRAAQAGAPVTAGTVSGSATESRASTLLQSAIRAAEFLRRELYDEPTGTLYRSFREGRSDIPGFAEDYAYLVQGLLDLYEASFEIRWLQWAERLQARMDELFWDAGAGGYFNSRADDPGIIARLKEDYDGAEPAPGSVAASNLLRLAWMLGDNPGDRPGYRERAGRTIEAFRGRWERAPQALPQMLCALELARQPPRTVVLAGDPQADDFRALAAVLHERLGPRRALLAGGEGQRWLAARLPYLAGMKPRGSRATAYLCENFACRPPVTQPAELRRMLA
jgi:uncharacterized protein YyaL (SSP411 family)